MSYTQTQLDAIEAAIATGHLSVQFGERKVVYRSMEDMRTARDDMRRELGLVSAPGKIPGTRRYGEWQSDR